MRSRRDFIACSAVRQRRGRGPHAHSRRLPKSGFWVPANDKFPEQIKAFHKSLGEAGYVQGKNLIIESKWAAGDYGRLPQLARELASQNVALIATAGGVSPARAAKDATATTPIVFVMGADPVHTGLVSSLSRPGGNVTGITSLNLHVGPKRVELLRELLPTGTTVALLINPTSPNAQVLPHDMQVAARALALTHHVLHAQGDRDLELAFGEATRLRVSGLVIGTDAFFISRSQQLAELSMRHAIPSVFQFREFAAAGGLMSYGSNFTETYRLLGQYVVRILRGEKPADMPVQQATRVELVINLKTAKALGVTFPPRCSPAPTR